MLSYTKDQGVCSTHLRDFSFPCKSTVGKVGAQKLRFAWTLILLCCAFRYREISEAADGDSIAHMTGCLN